MMASSVGDDDFPAIGFVVPLRTDLPYPGNQEERSDPFAAHETHYTNTLHTQNSAQQPHMERTKIRTFNCNQPMARAHK